jgi:RNA polymerase sigma factor (sigma-70 family)
MKKLETKTPRTQEQDIKDILSIRAGNKEAFAGLYKRHKGVITHNYMLKLDFDKDTVDDLIAELFAKVYEKLDMYNDTWAFSTWLGNVANNFLIDHLRVQGRKMKIVSIGKEGDEFDSEDRLTGEVSEGQVSSGVENPESLLLGVELKNKIHRLVDLAFSEKKNDNMLNVVKMRFYEELSYEEISKETGLSLTNIKAILHRATKVLHKTFVENGISYKGCLKELRKSSQVKKIGELVDGIAPLELVLKGKELADSLEDDEFDGDE